MEIGNKTIIKAVSQNIFTDESVYINSGNYPKILISKTGKVSLNKHKQLTTNPILHKILQNKVIYIAFFPKRIKAISSKFYPPVIEAQ